MTRLDWELILAGAAAGLEPGERVTAVFGAMIPHEFYRGHVMAAELVPLLWIMDHSRWRHRTRAAGRSAQIPLAPRMIIAVTGRRLVIWAAPLALRVSAKQAAELCRVISGDLPDAL